MDTEIKVAAIGLLPLMPKIDAVELSAAIEKVYGGRRALYEFNDLLEQLCRIGLLRVKDAIAKNTVYGMDRFVS